MKLPTDDIDYNFIEHSLQMLGVRFKNCECCGKRLLTQVAKLDNLCDCCFNDQKKLTESLREKK